MKKALGIILAAATVLSCVSFSSLSADAAIKGDLNGDNTISLRDASIAQKIDVGLIEASSDQLKSGDLNGDGRVSSQDSLILQKYVCLDKDTIEMITPNREERINFVAYINQDRQNLGLPTFSCTPAHLEAGNIRAQEYLETLKDSRPDGSTFYSVLTECNLNYNPSATPQQLFVETGKDSEDLYQYLLDYYVGNDKMYTLMTSSKYNTMCVGSVKMPGNTDKYYWYILIN